MFQIFKFFQNNRTSLLFLFLEFVAFVFIIRTHSYHQSKYLNSTNAMSGYLLQKSNNIHSYFGLKNDNQLLIQENLRLKNELEQLRQNSIPVTQVKTDTLRKYSYISADVINNQYLNRNNILTLNKGKKDGIKPNMGVILPNGIVGITLQASDHFSTVLSLLNSKPSFNVKFKKNNHFGSLQWNGKSYTHAQLWDIPIQADVKVGDTIVSGGLSKIFPDEIPVGTVSEVKITNKKYDLINVKLFGDFSALSTVYVVINNFQKEQTDLEQQSDKINE